MPKFAYFNVQIGRQKDGAHRIEFELFHEVVPKTVMNFLELCRGVNMNGTQRSYAKTPFHRVIKNFMVQGGDITFGDGTGRLSIFGPTFDDENLKLKHNRPFMLSMANSGPNSNGCQFFITCLPCPHLDGKHVVFGKVISGFEVVRDIENVEVDNKSRPLHEVLITECGEFKQNVSKRKTNRTISKNKESKQSRSSVSSTSSDSDSSTSSSSSSDSSDSSGEEKRKKRARKKISTIKRKFKKQRHNSSPSLRTDSNANNEKESECEKDLSTSTLPKEDLPAFLEIRKSFLYRKSRSRTPEKGAPKKTFRKQFGNTRREERVRGRGNFRFSANFESKMYSDRLPVNRRRSRSQSRDRGNH